MSQLRRDPSRPAHLPPWAPRAAHDEWRELQAHPIFQGGKQEHAPGDPVLLVGGFGAPPRAMRPLSDWLEHLGYEPHVFCWHQGVDCGERTAAELASRLRGYSSPPIVIAHSRGGQFARVTAWRDPARVRALITLGTPFVHLALQPLVLAQAAVLSGLGTIGVRNVIRLSCVRGRCCRQFRHDLAAPWQSDTPLVSIYSTADKTVKAAACVDPAATNKAIGATHAGMLASVESFQVVAEVLAAVMGRTEVRSPA